MSRGYIDGKTNEEIIGDIGFGSPVVMDDYAKKKVLITGAGSYIGESFRKYAEENYKENFYIDTIDMIDGSWRDKSFDSYDIVYHVAGIAHADIGDVSDDVIEKYYKINTDLAIEVAKKSKEDNVKQFIFMSSMIVYGGSDAYEKGQSINKNTVPKAANFYGDSKLQADVAVRELAEENFKVIVIRPPMIYGQNSRGNYPVLAKLAKTLPLFPDINNKRSMLHIDNFCEFLCQIMLINMYSRNAVVLIPQNAEWTKTSEMVKEIAKLSNNSILILSILNPVVDIMGIIPGKIGCLVKKAFGSSYYDKELSEYPGLDYIKYSLAESIARTEGDCYEK